MILKRYSILFLSLMICLVSCDNMPSNALNLLDKPTKLNVIEHNPAPLKNVETDDFLQYSADNDYPYVYDEDKDLKLNFIRTSKKGKNPLIIFIPPGSFLKYDKDEVLSMHMSREFARAGFNTATISYTLLSDIGFSDLSPSKLQNFVKAKVSDAIKDVSTATSFLTDNHQEFNFDPQRVYLVGHSAGAILALHSLFTDNEELDQYNESYKIQYARPKVKGIVAISGALFSDHYDDLDLKDKKLLMFHGDKDAVVPFGYGKSYSGSNDIDLKGTILGIKTSLFKEKQRSLENLSASYTIPDWIYKYSVGQAMPKILGSKTIYDTSNKKHIRLVQIKGGKHVFMVNKNGTLNQSYDFLRKEMLDFFEKN